LVAGCQRDARRPVIAVLPFARTAFGGRRASSELFDDGWIFVIPHVAVARHDRKHLRQRVFRTPKQLRWIDPHRSRCVAPNTNCGRHQAMDGQRVMTVNTVECIEPYRMRGEEPSPVEFPTARFASTGPPNDLNKTGDDSCSAR